VRIDLSDEIRLSKAIDELDCLVRDPRRGLNERLFLLVSRLTPLVNVDLLISGNLGTLLVWREDQFYRGWHIPGGILRFKELAEDRIREVARLELDAMVDHDSEPIAINQKINSERDVRGHFIALLYRCVLRGSLPDSRKCRDFARPVAGEWAWHASPPDTLLPQHAVYRPFIGRADMRPEGAS
jgi:ADP-ribose pyrophosphatase YjhB (NUDIX family)